MKLSISNIAWGPESDQEMYRFISESGFSGLEIAPTRIFPENPYSDLAAAKAFAEALKAGYGLEIASMQSISFGKSEAIFGSDEERAVMLDYLKKAIDFAAAVLCSNLVFGSPKNRIIGEGQEDIALEFFKECGAYAESKQTIFALEPNPEIYGTNFITHTQEAFDFVKSVNSKGLKINFDYGTFIENNESLDIVEKNLDLVHHIHISEPYLEVIKTREAHRELAEMLRRNGYGQYVSIEMKNSGSVENVKEVITYIKNLFHVA